MGRPRILKLALAACLALSQSGPAIALACTRDAMLVFDASASMAELGFGASGPTRVEEARDAVARVLPDAAALRRIGLLTYGPGTEDACAGIDVRFAPRANAAPAILEDLDALEPAGLTPLTASVQQAAITLGYETTPGIVVLVTDGSETCGGHPCALGHTLSERAADLTVHVIGFRLVVDPFSWNGIDAFEAATSDIKCLVEQTGGTFVTAETVDTLSDALSEVLTCPVIGQAPHARDAVLR